jgi:hypothetical protein
MLCYSGPWKALNALKMLALENLSFFFRDLLPRLCETHFVLTKRRLKRKMSNLNAPVSPENLELLNIPGAEWAAGARGVVSVEALGGSSS